MFFSRLFDSSDFPPRWHCGNWTSSHGWLHILSDLGVWSAYVAIPCLLLYFFLRRKDLPFRKIFLLFGAFILACGTTHLMEAIIFWWPVYRLAGVIKLLTALVSWGTVLALVPVVPRAMAMRSPEELEHEVEARKRAEAALKQANDELEHRIAERTAELVQINQELRLEQERLRTTRELVQRVADAVPALISYIDRDAHYRLANGAYELWFGRPSEEVLGKHMREVLGGSAWDSIHHHVDAALAGQAVSYEAEVAYQPGGTRWISASYTPDVDEAGEVRGIIAHVTDITARKQVEEALQETDRRKDEFLALLAHELRNPLAPLRNGLQVVRSCQGDQATIDQVHDMMERQLRHLVHLVDDLLDVSRISRGKVELRKEQVDLSQIVHNAVETCDVTIKERGHQLAVTLPPEKIVVHADQTRLVQALCNLLTNAAKYTEPGGQICLAVQRETGEAVVTVTDTGVGIPAPMLPRVFDMFTQVDRSLEKSQGGLGIGLTIVKRIVEMHGGAVEAQSEGHGKGSQFTIRLPIACESLATCQPPEVNHRPHSKRRVLVVDDNRDAATSLRMMLTLMGNEVHVAHDGLEAVHAAEQCRPDLILMDIGMPGLNGFDATRRIREQPWSRGIAIVALSGWGQQEDKRKSEAAGCDGHMVKPVDLATLQRWLDASTPRRLRSAIV